MSHIDRSITNHQVIPVVQSDLFEAEPASRLACGLLAVNGVPLPGFEDEYRAHFDLRRRVYVDQTGQLDASELNEDGTDRDDDDARSVTFAVFENHEEGVRVVGVARLIVRGDTVPLPVEEFCPESFGPGDVTASCVEVSRVIARHETAVLQDVIQYHLFAMMLAYISKHQHERTFAIIEPWLERHLVGVLAIQRIGEPTYVEHYLDYNLPIEVDIPASIDKVNTRNSDSIDGYRAAEPALTYFGRASRGTLRNRAA
ncbi:GNAT family N-acetyltransferase [Leucobacter rhizosphaerae]|uniref:GNAT family N-acetyltransferase n=1 Tax=Leucobacter rhizosphaerae TaxID=2932245 RepID=A0ABY4FWM7_9MICO|nr:GNAT family N-acyltransferase [Leucobacter rhizosphaerae]UOQ60694.1 GNAT family N-acetyltransferase [Leucobacter rhizosphaerae]